MRLCSYLLLTGLSNLTNKVRRLSAGNAARRAMLLVAGILLLPSVLLAQNNQYAKNTPDQTMRSDARIDPSSHALSIQIPLGAYPGRAGLSLPISITYSSKFRHLELDGDFQPWFFRPYDLYYLYVDNNDGRSVAGWTNSLAPPRIEGDAGGYDSWSGNLGQPGGVYPNIQHICRIRIILGDGSSHELRKDDTPRTSGDPDIPYYSVDNSQMRFEGTGGSGDTGTLFLPEGSRYNFVASQATQYIDRHGNSLSYDNTLKQWTDTLGRTFTNPFYSTGYPQSAGNHEYRLPGFNGNDLVYSFRWRYLRDPQTNETVLTDPNQELYYPGDYDCGQFFYNPDGFHSVSPSLFPNNNPRNPICANTKYNPVVLAEVVLPNGKAYRFTYNVWGEIDKMYFPTGGYERYQYAKIPAMSFTKRPFDIANRGVTDRWVSSDGTSGSEVHWQYGIEFTPATGGVYATTMTAPDGTLNRTYLHAQPDPYDGNWNHSIPYGFDDARSGRAYDDRVYSAVGQMLRRSLTEWTVSGPTPGGYSGATRDARVTKQVEILQDTGSSALAKTTTYDYDQDLNRILTTEYGYVALDLTTAQTAAIGSIPTGSLLRTTEVTYLVNDAAIDANTRAAYRARNMLALPTSTRVKDAGGNIVAQSFVNYDEAAYALITAGSATGWTDPGTNVRGNATTTGQWLNTTNAYLQTHAQYDQFGNVRSAWDAKGNQSQVDYSSGYQYAFPTTTTSAVPDLSGQYGSTAAFVTTTTYDATSGLITSTTDVNNQTTTFSYVDPQTSVVDSLNRIRTVTRPDGGLTTFNYNDTPGSLSVQTLTKQDANPGVDASQYFDGLGRPTRSFLNVGGGNYNTSDTQYDSMGRVSRVSNPYVSTGAGSAINPLNNWTTSAYDALGRAVSVTTPDSAQVTTVYGGSTSNVLGPTVTVTDQAGKLRRSVTDALGRLVRVDEPDGNGNLGDVSSPNQPTNYLYDTVGNLRSVTQGSQQRFFAYDSLSRLLRARNPELAVNSNLPALSDSVTGNSQWSMAYTYDNNGNLTQKTDARGVVSNYAYDTLNRNTTVTYTNDPASTPAVSRFYDGYRTTNNNIPNSKGRLWQTETGGADGSRLTNNGFDALGRPFSQSQQFYAGAAWSQAYTVQRSYNLAGGVTAQTYPSGHSVTFNYDQAGRLGDKDSQNLAFTGNLGDGVTRTYSRGISYSPFGSVAQEQFGTQVALYHKLHYNVRGQLYDVRLSSFSLQANEFDWNRGCLAFYYGGQPWGQSGMANNGNITMQQHFAPADEAYSNYSYTQDSYNYDSLNRLASTSEIHGGPWGQSGQDYQQVYDYDRWGNRTINPATSGVNNTQFDKADAQYTNRIYAPGDTAIQNMSQRRIQYDSAGNQTNDSYTGQGQRTYDAENRMTSAGTAGVSPAAYTYNADGQRVRRVVPVSGPPSSVNEVWQVYGMDGELLAEYAQNAAATTPQKEYGYRNGQLLISADASALPAVPEFSDNFNDNSLDATKWTVFAPTSPATVSEQSQQLRITLPPNTAAYNGVYSNATYDLRGKTVQVEVAQAVSQGGWSENYLQVVLDSQNDFLIDVGSGSMIFRSRVNGVNDSTVIGYDQTAFPYWRIRHDQTANTVSFETSTNGVNWTTRKTVTTGFSLTAVRFYLMAGAWGTGNGSPGAAKYDNFQLAESGVPPAPVTNVALNKPATQVSTYSTAVAGLAVDGNANGNFNGNSVTHTAGGSQEWWQVDLGSSYALETIKVWNRTDCCGDRLSNFYVFVSDQPFASSDLTTTINQAGVSNYYTAGQGGTPTFISANRTGRYVRVQLSAPGVLSLAEVEVIGSTVALANINWLVTDQLGTPRMILDKTGALANVKRHDYLPFGEELTASQGLRTATMGYIGAADGVRQKFTQKERDIETGLDYFGARYYASTQGRFTSTDPAPLKMNHLANPQDLNRYAYVSNDPLKFIDPDGQDKIQVVIETYIPTPATPSVAGNVFQGDDRRVPEVGQPQESGTFRTQQIITVETDPSKNGGNPLVAYSKDTGITYRSDAQGHEYGPPSQAKGDTLTAGATRNQDGSVEINAHGNEKDPKLPSWRTPGITYDYNVNVKDDGKGAITVTVSGSHDRYPAHVITASRIDQPKAKAITVYSFDPVKEKTTPWALEPPASNQKIKPIPVRLP